MRFLRIANAFCRASGPDRTAAICYAVGWTQHSTGVQTIRTAAILQLLLGNIGRPGGGILALRGHASIQGSTDIPTLFDILPGYLPMPAFDEHAVSLDAYVEKNRSERGGWSDLDRYIVSLLKAWYGEDATAANEFGFGWLPRTTGDHSHLGYWLEMADARPSLEGLFVMGQNPAVGAPNARLERRAMANLQWLVVRDMVETETATFWLDSPEIERGELRTADIATEVFFFPAASHAEKDGCFTNTQRLLQWRDKAVDPPADARSEAWFVYHLGRRLKARAAAEGGEYNRGLRALTWDYLTEGPHDEPAIEQVLQEINGRAHGRRPAASRLLEPCRRWQHRVRLLDLFRRLPAAGTQPRPRPRRRRPLRSRLGLRLARRPAHSLQPRLRAPRRRAVERTQEAGLVGRGERRVDRARYA